jgi:hypothetical protein
MPSSQLISIPWRGPGFLGSVSTCAATKGRLSLGLRLGDGRDGCSGLAGDERCVALAGVRAWRGGGPGRGEVEERGREAGSRQVATWGPRDVGCCESRGRTRHQVHSIYLATRQAPLGGGPTAPRRERCVVLLFLAQVMEVVEAKSNAAQRPPSIAAAGRVGWVGRVGTLHISPGG